jgi:hypothetical protein
LTKLKLSNCFVVGSQPVNQSKCFACVVKYSCLNYCAYYDAGHQRGNVPSYYL